MGDGKESSCDINLTSVSERADLATMSSALDLDGQILTLGATTMGYWKMRTRQPAVLIRAILGKSNTTMTLVRFEPNPETSRKPVASVRGVTSSAR